MLQFVSALHGLYISETKAPRKRKAHQGQGLVEYALIIAFVAVVVIVSMTFLQGRISGLFTNVGNQMDSGSLHGCPAGSTAIPYADQAAYGAANPGQHRVSGVVDNGESYDCWQS